VAVRFKVWRRGVDVWLRIEHPGGCLSTRLAYNEAERVVDGLKKAMEKIFKGKRGKK
jgi:hypothetical protein